MAFVGDNLLLIVALSTGAIILSALILYVRAFRRSSKPSTASLKSVKILLPFGREGVLNEIKRLRDGGEVNETLMRSLSAEDKALFEVALIEALTELPREEQHLLRAGLVRHGYDEQCARRLMKGEISDRVRASTLLDLLRPQWQTKPPEPLGQTLPPTSAKALSAKSGGVMNSDGDS